MVQPASPESPASSDQPQPPATSETPAQPQPPAAAPAASASPRRMAGSVTLNLSAIAATSVVPAESVEARPIDQALLEQYWAEAMDALKDEHPRMVASIRSRKLRLVEPDLFAIEVPNNFIVAEAKPHLMYLLDILRHSSGRPELNCRFDVVYEEQEAIIYSARDKYSVMSQANPMLATFKVLFPEVDL